jgi:hypothetical protein
LRWLSAGSFWGGSPVVDFTTLYDSVASCPRSFSRRVKEYCQKPFANLAGEVPKKPCLQHLGSIIDCQTCGLGFGSLQQPNLHMFKAHGVRNPLRVYVSTTHCCVCLKEFHTRERALNHVRYRSATC